MTEISFYKLKAAHASIKQFDPLAHIDDTIEVSLWDNGEGFDAHLCSHGAQDYLNLSWGQFDALKKLVKALTK